MSEDPIGDESTPPPELHLVPRDTSFEHPLDETAPKPEPVHDGDGIEIPRLGGERRPIIPEHLQTWQGIQSTAGQARSTPPGSTPCSTCCARRCTWSGASVWACRRRRQDRRGAASAGGG